MELSRRNNMTCLLHTVALLTAFEGWSSRPARADGFSILGEKKDLRPPRERRKVDPSLFLDGPEGLRYYDVKVGTGTLAEQGDRVVIHYEAKWRGVTFITSRQGAGVTGGDPYGFDLGATGNTRAAIKGLNLGVQGMRIGGLRKLIVPPELAYGDQGVMEIPPGATLDIEVELLSVKMSPFGGKAGRPSGSISA